MGMLAFGQGFLFATSWWCDLEQDTSFLSGSWRSNKLTIRYLSHSVGLRVCGGKPLQSDRNLRSWGARESIKESIAEVGYASRALPCPVFCQSLAGPLPGSNESPNLCPAWLEAQLTHCTDGAGSPASLVRW